MEGKLGGGDRGRSAVRNVGNPANAAGDGSIPKPMHDCADVQRC